jgi:glutaredoxin
LEDVRQACIQKYYDTSTFWKYLMRINEKCYSIYRDSAALDECWREAANTAGVDVAKVEKCVSDEGVELMREDEQVGNKYGVRGSPTLIINGQRYSGARSSEAFKQAICSAFIEAPEECGGETLSTEEATVAGGCA